MKQLISIFIFISVVLLVGGLTCRTLRCYVKAGTTVEAIKNQLYKCETFKPNASENKIILRIDDIQAFSYRDTTIKMIEDAFKNQMKITIGVIPNKLASDVSIVSFIKRDGCNLEIAQHGWDHQSSLDANGKEIFEFQNLDEGVAEQKIKDGKNLLEKLFNTQIVSFIPPGNSISAGTKNALSKSGFKVISGEGENAFDYAASTYDWAENRLLSPEEVLKECEGDLQDKHMCVIMLHPQDSETNGVIDKSKYSNYMGLLNLIKSKGFDVVTFKDVYPQYANYVPLGEAEEYLVEDSETLWDIAEFYYNDGTKWPKILEKNKDKVKYLPDGSQALVEANTKILIPIEKSTDPQSQ